ncbi:MAG: DUF4178 domain-containing protein [Leptospirales bacterium]|nr:DUF4178 domain-containing protein [Leptospirales bacterium]
MKTLRCHNCGGELVRGSRISKYKDRTEQVVRCLQCNSEFDQYSGEYYIEFIDSFIFDKDSSVLEIGLKGQLNDIEYEIVGRVRYQDESSYEKSTWDEWILKTPDGNFSYIVEENDKIYFYQEYKNVGSDRLRPTISINKTEQKNPSIEFEVGADRLRSPSVKKILSYTGRIVIIEGDIPCKVEIGDGVQFYDFKRHGEDYTLKRCNKTDIILSCERISLSELIVGFNIEKFQNNCNRMNNKQRSLKQESRVYAVSMIIALILSAYNFFGDIPIKEIMNSKSVLSENLAVGDDGDKVYESQIVYGSFDVPEKNRLYNVTISIDNSKFLETEVLTFRLMFINEDRLPETLAEKNDAVSLKETFDRIDAFLNPIESYAVSGYIYSADDNMPVYRLSKEFNFVVDESGKYYFYLEIFSNCIIDIDSIAISMSRTDSSRYYLLTAFIFFILCGVCIKRSRYYKEFTKSMLK